MDCRVKPGSDDNLRRSPLPQLFTDALRRYLNSDGSQSEIAGT